MKIEIAHDALARKVYERASAEDKMRLKITTFIKMRYANYVERGKDRRQFLPAIDLSYVKDYKKHSSLTQEEISFISNSEKSIKDNRIMRYSVYSAVLLILLILLIYNIIARNISEQKTIALEESNRAFIAEKKRGEELLRNLVLVEGELTEKEKVLAQALEKVKATAKALEEALEKEKASAKELERALMDLKKANEKLALQTKKELAEAQANQKKAEREYTQLKTTVDTKIQTIENSYTLSTQAVQKMEQKDKATAFKLAAEAWENNPNNKQAVETLKKIHQSEGGGDNFNKFMPVDKIIEKYQSQFGFKRKR